MLLDFYRVPFSKLTLLSEEASKSVFSTETISGPRFL